MTCNKINRNYSGGKPESKRVPCLSSTNGRVTGLPIDPNRVLLDHACETMPDSLSRRDVMLQALKAKIHPRHPAYVKVCAQLAALEAIAELQMQLQAELQKPVKSISTMRREAAR